MSVSILCRASQGSQRPLWRQALQQKQRLNIKQRAFSTSRLHMLAVSEMSQSDLASLQVKQDRLMNDIHSTCEWGKGEAWGE